MSSVGMITVPGSGFHTLSNRAPACSNWLVSRSSRIVRLTLPFYHPTTGGKIMSDACTRAPSL